jgi:WD40 repeat protein
MLEGHTSPIRALDTSIDGKLLATGASGDTDTSVIVWDIQSGEKTKRLRGYRPYVTAVAFAPKDAVLVVGSEENHVDIWDCRTWEKRELLSHSGTNALRYSSDGKTLAVGWHIPEGNNGVETWRMEGINFDPRLNSPSKDDWVRVAFLDFYPDSKTLVTVGNGPHHLLRPCGCGTSILCAIGRS